MSTHDAPSVSDADGAWERDSSVAMPADDASACGEQPAPERDSSVAMPADAASACREQLAIGAHADAPPFRTVGFTVSSLGYAASRRFRETLAPLRLEPREFALLRAVAAAEGQSQQAIGERLQIPASRMVAFVDALQARGLLERRTNPQDRRAHALHLTTDGRQLLGQAMTAAIGLERHLCADLTELEREQLLDLLQRVGWQLGLPPGIHAAHVHAEPAEEQP